MSGPGDKLQTREFRRVVECVKILLAQHDGKQSLIGMDYFSNREYLGAYLLYQWVIHYQEGMSLLGELPTTPKRALDVCSGPSPLGFAALRHGVSEAFAADKNQAAMELGAEICGRFGLPLSVRRWNCLKEPLPIEGHFDLITLGYALPELFPNSEKGWQEKQDRFIDYLLQKLTSRGYLVLVESSFAEDNQRILSLRDRLVKAGVPIQAPCIWRGECPALKTANSPCYAQRDMEKPHLIKEIQRSAGINLSSLKMSYLIIRSPKAPQLNLPDEKLYRIISPPVESYQGKRFYLCGIDGKKTLGSHFEEQPDEARAFNYLKRGELVSIDNALEQQGSMEIVEGTTLKVQAACGKPVEEIAT